MAKEEGLGWEITELRLGLPGDNNPADKSDRKRGFSEISEASEDARKSRIGARNAENGRISTKSQVVGWPPVCSYRRKNSSSDREEKVYVKVSMDGAPFLRKIDLSTHEGYASLVAAFEKLFDRRFEEMLEDEDTSEYVPIYEDKDEDWMLVGDVPWEMFVGSCKRLRIMKRSEAKGFGLQPRSHKKRASKDG